MIDPLDFLMGALDPDQQAAAEQRMRDDPAFRAEVESLRPVVDALMALPDEAWDPPDVGPPPRVETSPAQPTAPVRAPRRAWWRMPRISPLVLGVATCLTLAAGVALGIMMGRDAAPAPGPAAPDVVARMPLTPVAEGQKGSGTAEMLSDRELVIDARGLEPSRGDFYTVWLLNKDMTMEAVGSFRVPADGAVRVRIPTPLDPRDFDFVDVSVEPNDGVPTHSGNSVLRGSTS